MSREDLRQVLFSGMAGTCRSEDESRHRHRNRFVRAVFCRVSRYSELFEKRRLIYGAEENQTFW